MWEKMFAVSVALLLVLSLLFSAAFAVGEDDVRIVQEVVDRFLPLTQVPRPSHHEERIGEYLFDRAVAHGLQPERDAVGNVIVDVPATPGMEDRPPVILQSHMDMVCAADDGFMFDPLTDPIRAIVTDETITADGTSLGSDDGIGVALCLCVSDGLIAHGPVRIIYTVNEEDGLDGAFNLDPKYVSDAAYLINLDGEESDSILVSTAAGVQLFFSRETETVPSAGYDAAATLSLKGGKGGHSGIEINKNRANCIRALAGLLLRLRTEGIGFSVASVSGGAAPNAIPSAASAVLAFHSEDTERIESVCAAWQQDTRLFYIASDPDLTALISPAELPDTVLSDRELNNMLSFVTGIPDGVHTVSPDAAGLVESSSNLGLFSCDAGGLSATDYIRSSDPERLEELIGIQTGLAESRGYTVGQAKVSDAWKFNPDSRLLAMAKNAYLELNGKEPVVIALHAGLECGTFAAYNPGLDMIAIGPDLKDVHTPRETCLLNSVPKTYRLLEKLLAEIR